MTFQTLQRSITSTGIALHSGQTVSARLGPDSRPGLRFKRLDLAGQLEVEACLETVTTTKHATTLQSGGASVSTTEHLLAALWSLGVTHCCIELDGPEVPILDGSARGWVAAIQEAGLQPLAGQRPIKKLNQAVWLESGRGSVLGLPAEEFHLSVAVDFDFPGAGAQTFDGLVDPNSFVNEIASARTFTLEPWLEPLRAAHLIQGGSTENAIVISDQGYSSPLRFPNELARHKALDVLGDMALLFGTALFQGHIIAIRAGHGPHRDWMQKVLLNNALSMA